MATARPLERVLLEVGFRVSELRQAAGLTQGELGERLGYSKFFVRKLENQSINMTLETLVHVAGAFKMDASALLERPTMKKRTRGRPPNRDNS